MKTIFKAYHKNSDVVAYHKFDSLGILYEHTFDENGYILTSKNPFGSTHKYTRDENGYEIACEDSNGYYEVKGKIVSKEKYQFFINQLNSKNLDGKEAEIEGRKYKLKLIK